MLSCFPRGVLGGILNLIESVSEGFPSYSAIIEFFESLSKAKLTINLAQSEFCHATITF